MLFKAIDKFFDKIKYCSNRGWFKIFITKYPQKGMNFYGFRKRKAKFN